MQCLFNKRQVPIYDIAPFKHDISYILCPIQIILMNIHVYQVTSLFNKAIFFVLSIKLLFK